MVFSAAMIHKVEFDSGYQVMDQSIAALVALGLVSNLLLILSPMHSIYRIWSGQMRNEKDIQALAGPYFLLYVQSHLWALYGVTTGSPEIAYINVLGAIISLMYLVVMSAFADEHGRTNVRSLLAMGVLGTGVACAAVLLINIQDLRAEVFAYAGVSFTILMMLAPVHICLDCIRSRTTAGYPMGLTVAGFVSCCLWAQYSALTHDVFYLIPNVCGILCNGLQIALVSWVSIWYPQSEKDVSSLQAIKTEVPFARPESLPLLKDSDDAIPEIHCEVN